jgi:two-component system alkaline phosphatase synthesis response regulator PhoP
MQLKILYVEDEPFIASALVRVLEQAGYQVEVAVDGEKGIEAANKEPFDLILLDLILPRIDGFEVLKQLKEGPATKNIPVIILSNLSAEEDKKKAKDLGAIDFMVKAFANPLDIAESVKKLLGPSGAK